MCCARAHVRLRQSRAALEELLEVVRLAAEMGGAEAEGLLDEIREVLFPVYQLVVQDATETIYGQSDPRLEVCVGDIHLLQQLVQGLGDDELLAGTQNLIIYMGGGLVGRAGGGAGDVGGKAGQAAAGSQSGPRGWEKSFKAVTREQQAEATAGQAFVGSAAVLPTVAAHAALTIGDGCSAPAGAGGGWSIASGREGGEGMMGKKVVKAVRLLKVGSCVRVGLKQPGLKLGRAWDEPASVDKVSSMPYTLSPKA